MERIGDMQNRGSEFRGSELIEALNQVAREKGIDKEIIYEAIETSLVSACKKNFGSNQNVRVSIDRDTGDVKVYSQKEAVEEVTDAATQISLDDARQMSQSYEIGDVVELAVMPRNFGRISAQTAKQVVVQKFREAEREKLFNEYITKEREIVIGTVQRREHRNVYIALSKIDAVLSPNEQIPGESYDAQDRIKVYVTEVKLTSKGPQVHVSRTHPELVKRLFEQEVPEVYDGVVEIMSIAREAGSRTKLAVSSRNKHVDAVGACVGQNGVRVNVVVAELRGEKIDIINWNEDPEVYIASALSPSRVVTVQVNPKDQSAKVVVPDNQLSLAIGRDGQNARLAAKLTGWRIDIKSESQARSLRFLADDEADEYDEEDNYEYDDGYEDDYDYEDDDYDDREYEEDGEYESGDGDGDKETIKDENEDEDRYDDAEGDEDAYGEDGGDAPNEEGSP